MFFLFPAQSGTLTLRLRILKQHYTVDHLALRSMKNGANSVMPCELQDT